MTRRDPGGNGRTRTYRTLRISRRTPPAPPLGGPDTCGAMGWVDGDGVDRFNFPQTAWPYPNVQMRATRSLTRASEVLAINILSLVVTDREWGILHGKKSAQSLQLARLFYRDCLSDLPTDGWCIPLETIREWVQATACLASVPVCLEGMTVSRTPV